MRPRRFKESESGAGLDDQAGRAGAVLDRCGLGRGVVLADNPFARIGELATVRALLTRALELDEAWEGGTIHEAMIAVESLPVLLGGSAARARGTLRSCGRALERRVRLCLCRAGDRRGAAGKGSWRVRAAAARRAGHRRVETAVDPPGESDRAKTRALSVFAEQQVVSMMPRCGVRDAWSEIGRLRSRYADPAPRIPDPDKFSSLYRIVTGGTCGAPPR